MMRTIDIQEAKIGMYRHLRRRVTDEFGSSADITLFYMLRHVERIEFVVCVVAFGKVLFGRGLTENEIVDALRRNVEECYGSAAEKIELYYLYDPAPESDGAGRVQGNVKQIKMY